MAIVPGTSREKLDSGLTSPPMAWTSEGTNSCRTPRMTTMTAYWTANTYRAEPRDAPAREVTLVAKEGVELYRGFDGVLLAARPKSLLNVPIPTAIQLGWCWIDEDFGAAG